VGRSDLKIPTKPVSLRDIARIAEVDVSTVSRSLNDAAGVSPDKADEIRMIADSLGYRPRPIRTKRAKAIGLVMATRRHGPDDPYLSQLIVETERVLAERNLNLNVSFVNEQEQAQKSIGFVQENRVDGVLIAGHPSRQLVQRIKQFKLPVVAINDSPDRLGISCVCSDPGQATYQAVLRLAAWGHRRIGMVIQTREFPSNQLRLAGFEKGLADAKLDVSGMVILEGLTGELQGGRDAVDRFLAQGNCPTALLMENDWMAVGAIEQLHQHGLSVPEDVSIIGYGDLWICQQHQPKLSSIHRSAQALLEKAIIQLLEEIESGLVVSKQHLIDCQMQWRDSAALSPDRQ
jgi:DNA-binding LacI/PurR family transcriptional regulator